MRFVKSKYKGDAKTLTIRPTGDWHLGHICCAEKVVDEWIQTLDETNRGLLMGDLLEFATKTSIGKGLFDTTMTPQRQKEYLIEKLRPKCQFIDGAVIGNHEERIVKDTSLDVMKDVCEILNIPYLHYQGVVKYAWNGVAYSINMWHGAGGGATISTAMKKVEDMANRVYSDVYCMGHFHKRATSDRGFDIPDMINNTVTTKKQHFVLTGSALGYDEGYGEMKGLQRRCLGFPTIQLEGRKGYKNIIITK